jgi:hypothetical protein
VGWLKDVFEDSSNVYPCAIVCINSQRSVAKVQGTNVVETKNVIGVAMSYQHAIQPLQTEPQRLLTKIRRGINEYSLTIMFDED